MSVHGLSGNDRTTLGRLREASVLVDIDREKLCAAVSNGTILYFCGDCDQAPEFLRHLEGMLPAGCRTHRKAEDGGALRLNPNVPIPSELRIDSQALIGLKVTRWMKNISTLTLQNHYPCGMAELASQSLPDVLWHLVETPDFVRKCANWGPALILPFFHVDYGDKRRTYFAQAKTREEIYI